MIVGDLYHLCQQSKRMKMVKEVVSIPKFNHLPTTNTLIRSLQHMIMMTWKPNTNPKWQHKANREIIPSMAVQMKMAAMRARVTNRKETT